MPTPPPTVTPAATEALASLGAKVRARRKQLRISAVAVAEAAGISRVTLFRIEKGEPSVTMGAWFAVFAALGLRLDLVTAQDASATAQPGPDRKGWIPARVRLADYPVLRQLAWHVHGAPELSPREALGIYERNRRHMDPAALSHGERDLIDALRQALGFDHDV